MIHGMLFCGWHWNNYEAFETASNQKNSSILCIGVNKIKIHFDTPQLCCGVVHFCFQQGPVYKNVDN